MHLAHDSGNTKTSTEIYGELKNLRYLPRFEGAKIQIIHFDDNGQFFRYKLSDVADQTEYAMNQKFVRCHLSYDDFMNTYELVEDLQIDFSPNWKGLNTQLLLDIFTVKKAYQFAFEQQAEYGYEQFMKDVESLEKSVNFENIGLSDYVSSAQFHVRANEISFHPNWLFADDVFEIMETIFGVCRLVPLTRGQHHLQLMCIIIPKSIISLYDPTVELGVEESLKSSVQYLSEAAPFSVQVRLDKSMTAKDIAQVLESSCPAYSESSKLWRNTVIIMDRKKDIGNTVCTIYFGIEEKKRNNLWIQHCFGFEFESTTGTVIKSWLRFGATKRIRFYPEYITSILPVLFAFPSEMSPKEYLMNIYRDQFKHGWTLHLEDATFNMYYKAITGDDHISKNYHREKGEKRSWDRTNLWILGVSTTESEGAMFQRDPSSIAGE